MPPFFKPVEIDGRLYVDGAFVNSVPADVVRNLGADYVVGIDLANHDAKPGLLSRIIPGFKGGESEPWKKGYENSDVMIHPDLTNFKAVSFGAWAKMYEIGYAAAEEAMPKILADIEALKKVKEIDPNIKTLYDMTVAAGNISEMTFIDGFSIEETFIDYDIVDQIHQNNKKVFVWTVNEPSNIINICKYDIDNILTDDPLTAREVINEEKLSDSTVDFVNLFFKEEMRTQYINQ